jgi:hypothetical protein
MIEAMGGDRLVQPGLGSALGHGQVVRMVAAPRTRLRWWWLVVRWAEPPGQLGTNGLWLVPA